MCYIIHTSLLWPKSMYYTSPDVYKFISQQTNDPIVERKTCRVSWVQFAIFQSDLDFYKKISPTFDGKKFEIPTPTLCQEERQRRRLLFRNERKLYKRKCDATGEMIISNYSSDKTYSVFKESYRWSELWTQKEYTISKKERFSSSFNELLEQVPHMSLMVKMNENCTYVNWCGNSKNCYLVFDTDFAEDSMYWSLIRYSQDVVDSDNIYYSNTVYASVNCTESSNLFWCLECDSSHFLYNCALCTGCSDCIWCTNLTNKQYCIDNIQYSKEEYLKKAEKRKIKVPHNFLHRACYKVNASNSIWNNLYWTKECVLSHNIWYSQNLRYCDFVTDCNNSYDISSFWWTTEWSIECSSIGLQCKSIYYSSIITANCSNIYYSYVLFNCKDMFGCAFMKNAQYCIFNKQYTKETYEIEVAKIIWHMMKTWEWWEFFDPSLSPFGYNETVAQEYFPLTRDEALARWYKRQDTNYDPVIPVWVQTLTGDQIPADISTVDESICKKILVCEITWRPFMIQKAELAFYQKHSIPLPRRHPDQRHADRMKLRPPRELHLRTCDATWKEILSVYLQDVPFKVYSQEAYSQEVFG